MKGKNPVIWFCKLIVNPGSLHPVQLFWEIKILHVSTKSIQVHPPTPEQTLGCSLNW